MVLIASPSPLQDALDVGYRYLDCAEFYGNEEMVGAALEGHSVKREDLYLVWNHNGLARVSQPLSPPSIHRSPITRFANLTPPYLHV
jgi:predicted oxidoreductase